MQIPPSIPLAYKALRDLGPKQLAYFAWYRFSLRSGYLRWRTPVGVIAPAANGAPAPALNNRLFNLPKCGHLTSAMRERTNELLAEADEVVNGNVRLFGGQVVPLQLHLPMELSHWTEYESGQGIEEIDDIKFIWEPGRFGWAYTLARAHLLNGDEKYAEAFWVYSKVFFDANPPNLGPHWASGQEVALRLIALVFAHQVFVDSPATTSERVNFMGAAIAAHATRIPPTLAYGRAQNNNHLLSEAAGLFTAGLALPYHPRSQRWRETGWRWFNAALQNQIAAGGTYTQHSTNYQRMVLQLALWVNFLAQNQNQGSYPAATKERLEAAVRWLLSLTEAASGRVPNLGPNDGTYILSLTPCSFYDYRPVLQAAALAFLGECPFPPGPWDEMRLWLKTRDQGPFEAGYRYTGSDDVQSPETIPLHELPGGPHVLRNPKHDSWAYVRVANFNSRPGHADQLHVDLWWRGRNIVQDPGTYLYNSPPPWDNSLSGTAVHSTISINDQDQMTRAGRFLWLDWAQARLISYQRAQDGSWEQLVAQHNGYRRLGAIHRREISATGEGSWIIKDDLLPTSSLPWKKPAGVVKARLHWLLPDWPLEFISEDQDSHTTIRLDSPAGNLTIKIVEVDNRGPTTNPPPGSLPATVQLVRAGELLFGSGPVSPTGGWISPTYGYKIPALSFSLTLENTLPLTFLSEFSFHPA